MILTPTTTLNHIIQCIYEPRNILVKDQDPITSSITNYNNIITITW